MPGDSLTTDRTVADERETIALMERGQGRGAAPMRGRAVDKALRNGPLTPGQKEAVKLILPSGRKRFFVHCQHRGQRVWKIVGDAATMDVGEARSMAADMLAAIRRGGNTPQRTDETVFEAAAEELFRSCERNCA